MLSGRLITLMSRYFFHLANGVRDLDRDGAELPDLAAARTAAVQYFAQSLLDRPEDFWESPDWKLEVSDAGELTLFTIHILAQDAPAVSIRVEPSPRQG